MFRFLCDTPITVHLIYYIYSCQVKICGSIQIAQKDQDVERIWRCIRKRSCWKLQSAHNISMRNILYWSLFSRKSPLRGAMHTRLAANAALLPKLTPPPRWSLDTRKTTRGRADPGKSGAVQGPLEVQSPLCNHRGLGLKIHICGELNFCPLKCPPPPRGDCGRHADFAGCLTGDRCASGTDRWD